MDQLPVIREGHDADLDVLVATLSDSFANDPVLNWVIPMPPVYADLFHLFIQKIYLPRGIVHMEPAGRGAALWLPPGAHVAIPMGRALLALAARVVLRKGLAPLWRLHEQGALFERHRPPEPHYYLQFIGCRQQDQGRGVGAALLKHGTRICDEQHMPAYLESSNARNVPLYQRHGFEVIHEQRVSRDGPNAWFMWREAR